MNTKFKISQKRRFRVIKDLLTEDEMFMFVRAFEEKSKNLQLLSVTGTHTEHENRLADADDYRKYVRLLKR